MNFPVVRLVRPEDFPAMREIYAPYITGSHTSFEYEVPTLPAFRERFAAYQQHTPCLVMTDGQALLGYAYASLHRSRTAYQWSVESSIYMAPLAKRQGQGRTLYQCLLRCLRYQGFVSVYAGITLPNPASVAFHQSQGFVPVGVYQQVGFKLGQWHDVGWWQLALEAQPADPRPPVLLPQIDQEDPVWKACFEL